MFPRASRSNSRRLVGLLAVASALALSTPPAAQARSTDRPTTRQATLTAPAEAGLFDRFLSLLRAVWQADATVPTGPGGTPTTTTPPEGSGIDPHGTPKPKP
jgi:hypothetical protein